MDWTLGCHPSHQAASSGLHEGIAAAVYVLGYHVHQQRDANTTCTQGVHSGDCKVAAALRASSPLPTGCCFLTKKLLSQNVVRSTLAEKFYIFSHDLNKVMPKTAQSAKILFHILKWKILSLKSPHKPFYTELLILSVAQSKPCLLKAGVSNAPSQGLYLK